MKRLGANAQSRKKWQRHKHLDTPDQLGIFPANWDAFVIFSRMTRHPEIAMNGQMMGFQVDLFWRLLDAFVAEGKLMYQTSAIALFDQYRVLESAYVKEVNRING